MVVKQGARIVHLTSVHKPQDVRIFYKECRTLAKLGFEVRLVSRVEHEAIIDGVRFIPIKSDRHRLLRFTLTSLRVLTAAIRQTADVYHFHDPELIPVGLALKVMGKRVIYDVHEGYSDSILDREWLPKSLRWIVAKLVQQLERLSVHCFDAIVCATPHIAESFQSKKTFVIRNFPMLEELAQSSGNPFSNRQPHFAFVGHISRGRGAVQMIDALDKTSNRSILLHLGCPFDNPQLKDQLTAMSGWKQVVAHGWMSRSQIAELYGQVLAGVVVFQPTKNYLQALPTKLFEYMSAGIPAIVSDFPILRNVIDENQCGIIVDPRNSDDIARAMDWIASNPEEAQLMGERGRQLVLSQYNWEHEAKQLLACYQYVLA